MRVCRGGAEAEHVPYPVPGLVPGTHVFLHRSEKRQIVDGRDKPGHGDLCGANLCEKSVIPALAGIHLSASMALPEDARS